MSRSSTFSSSLLVRQFTALRKAAVSLTVWALVSLCAVLAVDQWYRSVPHTHLDRRMTDFRDRLDEVEVLVLGNSQMHFGVDPQYVAPNTFNLAGPSQDLYYDARIVERFADQMPKLRVVLWGIAPFSFGHALGKIPAEKRRRALYDRYFERRGGHCGWRCRLARWFEMVRVRGDDPIGAFQRLWRSRYRKRWRAEMPNKDGYVPRRSMKERDDGKNRARFHERFYKHEVENDNYQYVVDAVTRLKARGVRVVFVRPPVTKTYTLSFTMRLRQRFVQRMRKLQSDTGAEYLDLRALIPAGKGYFRNSDHLQGQGVVLFSRRLGQVARRR